MIVPTYIESEELRQLKQDFEESSGSERRKLGNQLDDLANELRFGAGLVYDCDSANEWEDCDTMLNGFGAESFYDARYPEDEDLY